MAPALSRSTAIAPMTALSVHKAIGAMCSSIPAAAAAWLSCVRSNLLAATPPPTQRRCDARPPQGQHGLADQAVDHGLLKAGRQIGNLLCRQVECGEVAFPHAGDAVADGRLETAEAEIEPGSVVQKRTRQRIGLRIPSFRSPRDSRPAGIRQTQHDGHFVKRLARRVVDRSAQHFEIAGGAAEIEARMSAADNHSHARKHLLAAGNPAGIDVGMQMIHGHQRFAECDAQASWRRRARPAANPPDRACWPRRWPTDRTAALLHAAPLRR